MTESLPEQDALQEAAKVIATWIGYSWEGLSKRDISDRFPDWAWSGNGHLHYQGGQPGLLKLAEKIVDAYRLASTKSSDPNKYRDDAGVGVGGGWGADG